MTPNEQDRQKLQLRSQGIQPYTTASGSVIADPMAVRRQAEQQQAEAERTVAQRQKQEQKAAQQAQKDAFTTEQTQREHLFRAQGATTYTTADGVIHRDPLFEDKQAAKAQKEQEKAAKAAADLAAKQARADAIRSGRRHQINPVDGHPIYLESEQALEQRQKDAAEKLRKQGISTQIAAAEAEYGSQKAQQEAQGFKPLSESARKNLAEKALPQTKQQALFALQSHYQNIAKGTDKQGWWDVINNNATPEAQAARQHLQRLQDPNADLTEEDIAALSANDATKPLVDKLQKLQGRLSKDDELQKFHAEHGTRIADLILRRDAPEKWAETVRERRAQLPPEQLRAELEASNTDLTARADAIQQEAAGLNSQLGTFNLQLSTLSEQAAERRASGIPAGELVSYQNEDGTVEHWPRDLAAKREEITARMQDTQAQQADAWAALQVQQQEWNRDAALHDEAAQRQQQTREKQKQDFVTALKNNPATAGAGQALEALDAERQTRLADLQSTGMEAAPKTLQSIEQDYQTRAQAILDHAQKAAQEKAATARAATIAYRRDGFEADLNQSLPKVGLDPQNPEHVAAWWDAHKTNFSPLKITSGPLPQADENTIDYSAVLSDGSLAIHPAFTFDARRYAEAVEKSAATPEAKAKAMEALPEKQLAQAEAMLPMLKSVQQIPGIPSFTKWQQAQASKEPGTKNKSEAEQAKAYLDFMQSRGFWQKMPDTVARNFLAGLSDIGSQAVGTLGALSGSRTLSEAAASWSADADRLTSPLEAEGANSSLPAAVLGQTARMAGPVASMLLVTRGLGGGMGTASALAASQTAGSQYAQSYNTLREQGMSHAEAWKQTAPYALASGLVTAVLTAAGGKTGIEAALRSPAGKKAAQSFWKHALTNIPRQAGAEIAEELPDELFSQVSHAMSEGRKSPGQVAETIGQFWESSPTLIGSIALMGGAGGTMESYQETRNQEQGTNNPHPANLPETVAAAESAIDSFADPSLDEATVARTQDAARGVLYIAQGTPLTDLDADTLAALDIVEDPQKPGTFLNGRIIPNAKTGVPELQEYKAGMAPVGQSSSSSSSDSSSLSGSGMRPVRVKIIDGQPVISQQTLDNLETKLPAVRAAIPLNEKDRLTALSAPQSAAGGTASPPAQENPVPGTSQPGPQPARREESSAASSPVTQGAGTAPAPSGASNLEPETSNLEPAAQQRAAELATLLESRGLTAPQAQAAAEHVVSKQGIVGASAEEQYTQGLDDIMARDLHWVRGSGKNYTFIAPTLDAKPKETGGQTSASAEASPPDPFETQKTTVNNGKPSSTTANEREALTDRMVVAKQKAMKAVPVAKRPRFQKFYAALDQQLSRYAPAFPGGVTFTQSGNKSGLSYTGAGIAVVNASSNPGLEIDLGELFRNAEHIDSKHLPRFARQALLHEVRHIAALKVITKEQAENLWTSLTPKLKSRVYASYFAADLRAAAGKDLSERELLEIAAQAVQSSKSQVSSSGQPGTSNLNPATLPKADAFAMAHEFLRMLDEDAEFAGQTSEAMDAHPGLGKAILDFLAKVIDEIKHLIDTDLDAPTRVAVKEMQKLVEGARKKLLAGLPAPDKTYKGAPPADLATAADTRASVLSGQPGTRNQEPGTAFKPVLGSVGTAYTDSNDPVEFQWAVVDANSLTISNLDNGRINPDYPQELQPRDRTSAASEAQVNDIAKNFNLDRLSASSSVGDGAPIVGPDGVVESGNGRTMGARRSHATGKESAKSYRDALIRRASEFGLNAEQVEAVTNPVLVRVRTTDVNRTAFVLAANVSTIAPKREMEQAKIDAKQIVPDLFDSFVPSEDGEIFTAANADFIRGFVAQVVPPAERGQVIDAAGNLSQTGLRRIRNALFVHAYGTSPEALNALGRLTESIDATDTGLARALLAMAPRFAEQNARIANGALYPFSITENLAQALQKLADLRARGEKVETWLAQDRIPGIGDDPGPVTTELVKFLHDNRQRPRQIIDALDRYAKALDAAGDPRQMSIFGDEKPTESTLWKLAANWKGREPALAMPTKRVSSPMASDSGAAQNAEPSPGGLSEAGFTLLDAKTLPDGRFSSVLRKLNLPAIVPSTVGNWWNNMFKAAQDVFPGIDLPQAAIMAWERFSNYATQDQAEIEKQLRLENYDGRGRGRLHDTLKTAKDLQQLMVSAGKAKGFLASKWRETMGRLLSYDGPVYRGEETPPTVVKIQFLRDVEMPREGVYSGHSSSGLSNSFYPRIAALLSNGAVVSERIRISDHPQVSENAPRRYDIDLRATDQQLKKKAFRQVIAEQEDKVFRLLNDLVAESWEGDRWQAQKSQSRPLTGQAGESRQDMRGSGPSKTGNGDYLPSLPQVNPSFNSLRAESGPLAKASTTPSLQFWKLAANWKEPALAMGRKTVSSPMASASGAAQPNEPSPGGLSEAEDQAEQSYRRELEAIVKKRLNRDPNVPELLTREEWLDVDSGLTEEEILQKQAETQSTFDRYRREFENAAEPYALLEAAKVLAESLGFVRNGSSNVSEATYWNLPGADLRLRLAAHDVVNPDSGYQTLSLDARDWSTIADVRDALVSAKAQISSSQVNPSFNSPRAESGPLAKASTTPSLQFSTSPPLPPKSALKLYRTLTAKQASGTPLTPPQSQALERAERSLGQLFLFDTPNQTLKPAEDLVLEQENEAPGTKNEEQLSLFKGSTFPRSTMPQIPASERPALLRYLRSLHIPLKRETVPAASLKPSQTEILPDKVAVAATKTEARDVLISQDDYVLDGHHQWQAALAERGTKNEEPRTLPVIRLGIPVRAALAALDAFPGNTAQRHATSRFASEEYPYLGEAPADWKQATDPEAAIVNPLTATTPDAKVSELMALSRANIPLVERILGELSTRLKLDGKWSLKEPDRIMAKASRPSIREEKPWHDIEHVRDGLRFKVALDQFRKMPAIMKILRDHGVEVVKFDHKKMFAPKMWGWRFVAWDLRMPNGQLVEFYAPIPELEAAKDENHRIFEKWRNLPTDQYAYGMPLFSAWSADVKLSNQRYTAAFMRGLQRMGYSDLSAAMADWSRLVARASSVTSENRSMPSTAEGGAALRQAPDLSRMAPGGATYASPESTSSRAMSGVSFTVEDSTDSDGKQEGNGESDTLAKARTGWLGTVTDDGQVIAKRVPDLGTARHGNIREITETGNPDGDRDFRFNPATGAVYWWNPSRVTAAEKQQVSDWLEADSGIPVRAHTGINTSQATFNAAHGATDTLAKARTRINQEQGTRNEEPDLFSFNTGMDLGDLLTPAQKQSKLDQAQTLDLFGGRANDLSGGPEQSSLNAASSPPRVERPAPDSPPTSDYATKAKSLATHILRVITGQARIKKLTWDNLFKMADEAFGGTQAEGTYTVKDAYDALEMAVNAYITGHNSRGGAISFHPVSTGNPGDAVRMIRHLKTILADLPTQTKRTEETDRLQQFSTVPPLAFVANWVAHLNDNDVYLEPSAGTGGLAAFGKAAGVQVFANELSPRRAALLRATGIAEKVFEENAEQINNVLPPDIRPTVVVMNPPFSTSPTGTKSTDNATKHLESALARLAPGGRLVAIVGEGMAADRPAFRAWWQKIAQKYHLLANIQVNGAEYAKYGTTWDNQIVVIDKVTPPGPPKAGSRITNADGSYFTATGNEPAPPPLTGRVESIDDLPSLLYGIRNDRPEVSQSVSGTPRGGGSKPRLDTAGGSPDESRPPGGGLGEGTSGAGNLDGGMAGTPKPDGEPAGSGEDRAPVDSAPPADAGQGERPSGTPDGGNAAPAATGVNTSVSHTEELTDAVYDAWHPRITFPGAQMPPTHLAESAAMAAVDPPQVTYKPSIPPAYYADPLRGEFDQRLSAHALEAIALAGHDHQQSVPATVLSPRELEDWQKRFKTTPPTQFRRGFFIGDGTGAGKGRQIAGIIFDNWNQGRKRAVWISEPSLFTDARRDLNDVADLGEKLFEINATKAGDKIGRSQGIGFISYSTLRSQEQKPAPGTLPKTRVDQIVEWLGEDFDGVIAFDEAHNMGSAMETKGNRGNKEASKQALAGLELQQRLPNARVVYLSATGATEVSNLAFAERLGLWGPGTPFRDRSKFVSEIASGGVAAMELIAQNLKAMGLYVARSISWHDVTYDRASHALTTDQRQIYDDLAEGWQVVLRNMDEAMKLTGITADDPETGETKTKNSSAKSALRSKFWGSHQRFFNQLITAMKLPTVINAIERELDAQHSIVIQLVNTQEASLGRAISKAAALAADAGEEIDLETLDLSPRDQLLQLVQNAFPVTQMEDYTYEDGEGNPRTASRPALDSKGNPILNQEAVAMRDDLLDKLASIRVPSGPLEMLLDHFGQQNVAEVTGRTRRVVWKKDADGRDIRTIEKRTPEHGKREVADFQSGQRRILVFSKAGGTGRSFHADRRAKNQQKRVHILLQPGWQASAAVQGFGRTHRNNQVSTPHYLLAETDIVGEKRFMSSIARRLDQLGALTKGQRQTGSQGFFQARDNLESFEAKAALDQFYRDVLSGGIANVSPDVLEQQMGLKMRDKDGNTLDELPPITQFLNRLLSLKLDLQNAVFDAFSDRLDKIIETKLSAGTLDVGLENLSALSTKEDTRQTVYDDPASGAKAELVGLTLTQAAHRSSWQAVVDAAKRHDSQPWVRSKRTGKLFALTGRRNMTQKDGSVTPAFRLHGVTRGEWIAADLLNQRYDRLRDVVDSPVIRQEWQQQYDNAPATEDDTVHILTGTMLPIWDKIPGAPRIVRVQTDNGRRMIGRVVPEDMVDGMVSKLTGRKEVITPEKAVDQARHGQRVRLSNGWTLKESRVSGENRLELLGPAYNDHTLLDAAGTIKERIQWNMRYFLPFGSAPQVLQKLLTSFRADIAPPTDTLAKSTVTPYTPASYDTASPDPYTGIPSLITGSRLTREQGRAIGHAHAQRLRAGMSGRRDSGQASPALAADRAGILGVTSAVPPPPVLSRAQFDRLQKLPLIGEGAEAKVYADRRQGVVYKVLQGYAPVPGVIGSSAIGIWPQVYYTSDGRLDYDFAPAEKPRQLAVRLAVQTLVGGTPTEIVGIGPDGHVILKQPLSPDPTIGTDESGDDRSLALNAARGKAGLVEIPRGMLADPKGPRVFLAFVEGRPWLLMDMSPGNFVGDNQNQARINDAVVGQIPGSLIAKVPGLAAVVKQAAQHAKTLGDRSDRLFKATTAIDWEGFTSEPFSNLSSFSANQNQVLAKAATTPFPSLPPVPSVLAKLGWNHLDRAASAKIAAHTRWLTDPAKRITSRTAENIAGHLVAMWTGQKDPAPFLKAAHALKRELVPDSVLPREILAKKREMEIKTAMGSQRAMDLVRALSGNPKFSTIAYPPAFAENPMHRRNLYEAMVGERPMSSLPPEMQTLAHKLRAILVEIGQEAVKQGRMSVETFDNLRGTYMPHYYKEDVERERSLVQKFRLGVRDILAQRTTAWHITDSSQKDANGEYRLVSHTGSQWRFRSPEHMNAFYEDFITQQALAELQSRNGRDALRGVRLRDLTLADILTPSKLDPEIRGRLQEIKRGLTARFQRHKPLTIAEQEKAGLIMDPVYAIARYAAQMSHDNSTAAFFNAIAADKALVSDIATPGFTEIPDNPRFGRLAGKHVQTDIAQQVLEMIQAPNVALQIYDTLLGWWKAGKTVLNPGTHVRNVLGNLFFSQLAGNSVWNPGNVTYYKQAVTALRNGGAVLTEAYDQGVLGADFVSAELRQTLRQLLPDPATIVDDGKAGGILMGIGKAIGKYVGSPAGKAFDKISALYQAEDEVFKLAAYLKAKAMLEQQGTRNEELGTQAAAHVRQWFPYFDSGTSGTLKLIGRTALPFLGFYRESIRIFGEALKHRPLALATGLAVPSIITMISAMMLGLDDDDLDEIKKDMRGKAGKLLGPTPFGGRPLFSMLLPVRSDTGQVQQFDISAIHPFVDFMGTRVEGGAKDGWWPQMFRSFIAAGPLGNLLYSNMTGKDAFFDSTIVEPNMTTGESALARLNNLAKTVLPPMTPGIPYRDSTGKLTSTGGTGFDTLLQSGERSSGKTLEQRSPSQALLRTVGGLDVRNATPDLYRLADDWRKAHGYEVTEGMDYGSTTPASRARKALFAKLAQDEPNLTAIRNILRSLDQMGHPVRTQQDINRLLFYRDPLKLIGGNKAKGITAADAQAQFRASLQGEARQQLETALREYQRIQATAPSIIRQAQ